MLQTLLNGHTEGGQGSGSCLNLSEKDCWVFPVHLLEIAASGFLGLKSTIFVRSIGSKTMKKVIWAILSASALLVASPLSSYAGVGSVFSGAHARMGQAAWGGHPSSGSWGGHPSSGDWGHHHGGDSHFFFSGSVVLGPWWPWYPWYPYYPYYSYYPYYPYYAPAPAVAVEPQPQEYADSGQQQSDYWYYCQDPQGYYPYVQSCPGGWMKVVPQPAPPQQ